MRNSRYFTKIILSYILILIIPMISISMFMYFKYAVTFTEEIMNSTTQMLEQVKEIMDVHFKDLNNLSIQISLDKKLLSLLIAEDISEIDLYPDTYNAIRELDKYKKMNSMIEDIFLIVNNGDLVVSNRTKMSYDTLFSDYFLLSNEGTREISHLIVENDKLSILPAQPVTKNDITKDLVIYLQPLPVGTSYYKYRATLMISLDKYNIEKIINKILNQYMGVVYVLDDNNNTILYSTNNEKFDEEQSSETLNSIVNSEDTRNQSSYTSRMDDEIISYVESSVTNWKYICIIDSNQVLSKVDYIKANYIKVISICLIIGIFTTYVFARKNYSSIENLTEMLKSNRGSNRSGEINDEWAFINDSVMQYVQQNRNLQNQLSDYVPIITNSFILSLLNGQQVHEDVMISLTELTDRDIMKHSDFIVFSIYIEDYDTYYREFSSINEDMLKITILTAFEEQLESIGSIYTAEVERGSIGVIIGLDKKSKMDLPILNNEITAAKGYVEDQLKLNLQIGIGNIHSSLKGINTSYIEAKTALEYIVMKGSKGVITYDEICDIKHSVIQYYYSFEHEKEIVQHLRLGQFEEIESIINEIIDQIRQNHLSLELMKCICFDIVNTSIKVLDELNITNIDVNSYLSNIFLATTLDQTYDQIIAFYKILCDIVLRTRWWKDDDLRDEMLTYMHKHYMDSDLSVDTLADHFNLSRSYISKFFKDQVNCLFLDYLHNLRLTKSKELLLNTDRTISEIGHVVGYNSQTNFIRVFKRYEGITPTEYRKSMTNSVDQHKM